MSEPEPTNAMSASTARSLADLDRVNTMYVEINQYLTDLSQRQQKGKNEIAIY